MQGRFLGWMAAVEGWGFFGLRVRASDVGVTDALKERQRRMDRLRESRIQAETLRAFVTRYRKVDRARLQAQGWLGALAPKPGGAMIGAAHRSEAGERILEEAKDMLFALLLGDISCGVNLERTKQEAFALRVPREKTQVLECLGLRMEAASDSREDDVVLQVGFEETEDGVVRQGIDMALRLINLLELNQESALTA